MFLSSSKGITLSTTKNNLVYDVLTYTEFSSEEIQIPTFKFERLSIVNSKQKQIEKSTLTKDESLFLQIYDQGKDIDPAFYRSSIVPGDPHIGFRVEFKGEFVQGIGGPYRQLFSDLSIELIPSDGIGKLNLFCQSSNNRSKTGEYKDKYIITPSYKNSSTELGHYEFLGVLFGICIRTGVHIPLDLCQIIWKKLSDTPVTLEDIREMDEVIIDQINFFNDIDSEIFEGYNYTYSCELSDGTVHDLIPNGRHEKLLYDDRFKYLDLLVRARLTESDKQINAIKKGLYKVIPNSIIQLLTHKELERYISGSADKDVNLSLLKQFTKYSMDLNETSDRAKWLWEILEGFTPSEKTKFIKFCWAQERLPRTKDEYERRQVIFTIKPCMDKNKKDIFPKADTCFFALELPEYSSKEVMKNKILIAINLDNVSIDADKVNENNRNSGDYYEGSDSEY